MRKNLYIVLIVILLLFSVISIVLNRYIDTDGFLMNLATEIIGIFVTVIFVDKIIKNYEDEKWKGVEYKIKKYVQILINATISSVRNSFGYSFEDVCSYEIHNAVYTNPKENFHLMEKELIRISREILEPTVFVRVEKMNRKSWDILIINFKNLYESTERILSLFGSKLTPEQFEILLDIQETINNVFMQHMTWPDIIAVPDEDLPVGGRTPAVDLKHEINNQLSNEIKKILVNVRELYHTINEKTKI